MMHYFHCCAPSDYMTLVVQGWLQPDIRLGYIPLHKTAKEAYRYAKKTLKTGSFKLIEVAVNENSVQRRVDDPYDTIFHPVYGCRLQILPPQIVSVEEYIIE